MPASGQSAMIAIDIVADFVCPWCFIGKRRLETAIGLVRQTHGDFAFSTRWLPFFLNPDTPPAGEPYLPFLIAKFGSREAVEALFERVRVAGLPYGIDYAFEKIALRANTLQAHRLVEWAQEQGNADSLIERLFVAQFQRGEAIGDPALLCAIAAECGYSIDETRQWLESDVGTERLKAEERAIRAQGIRQVPSYILDQRQLIVGAEDPRLLADAIRERLKVSAGRPDGISI